MASIDHQLSSKPSITNVTLSLQQEACQLLQRFNHNMAEHRSSHTGLADFKPQLDDVIIVTHAKAGTTVLQNIVYQLIVVTGGVPDDPCGDKFDNIGEVVPSIEAGPRTGWRSSCFPFSPRVWKSHGLPAAFPPTAHACRHIVCVRDAVACSTSLLDFLLEWALRQPVEGATIREELLHQYLMTVLLGMARTPEGGFESAAAPGLWFKHVRAWLEAPRNRRLVVLYEEIVTNLRGVVANVARFLDIEVTDKQLNIVVSRCNREAMAGNSRFKSPKDSGKWQKTRARTKEEAEKGFKKCKLREQFVQEYSKVFHRFFGVHSYEALMNEIRTRDDYAFQSEGS